MKPEDVKKEKLEQELSEDELDGATGGKIVPKTKEPTWRFDYTNVLL